MVELRRNGAGDDVKVDGKVVGWVGLDHVRDRYCAWRIEGRDEQLVAEPFLKDEAVAALVAAAA